MEDNKAFKIVEEFGVLSETVGNGWRVEFNLVSWYDRAPKYEIRSWAPYHAAAGKGYTLTNEQVLRLKEVLNNAEIHR